MAYVTTATVFGLPVQGALPQADDDFYWALEDIRERHGNVSIVGYLCISASICRGLVNEGSVFTSEQLGSGRDLPNEVFVCEGTFTWGDQTITCEFRVSPHYTGVEAWCTEGELDHRIGTN